MTTTASTNDRRPVIAYVGAGVQAWESQIPAGKLLEAEGIAEVFGLADLDPVRAQWVASDRGVPHVFSDPASMLAARDIDLVVVATPHRTHFAEAKRALNAGCSVLVEKPLTETVAQARELMMLAGSRRLVLAGGLQYLYQQQAVLEAIRDGLVGTPRRISGQFEFVDAFPDRKGFWDSVESGGVTFDFLEHPVSVALAALDPATVPFAVAATGWADAGRSRFGEPFKTDDTVWVTIQCTGNVVIELKISWAAFERRTGLEVCGPHAKVKLPMMAEELNAADFRPTLLRREPDRSIKEARLDLIPVPTEAAIAVQLRAVCAAVLGEVPLPFGPDLAVLVQMVLNATLRSIASGGERAPVGSA